MRCIYKVRRKLIPSWTITLWVILPQMSLIKKYIRIFVEIAFKALIYISSRRILSIYQYYIFINIEANRDITRCTALHKTSLCTFINDTTFTRSIGISSSSNKRRVIIHSCNHDVPRDRLLNEKYLYVLSYVSRMTGLDGLAHVIKFARDHWPVYGMSKHSGEGLGGEVNMSVTIKLRRGRSPWRSYREFQKRLSARF